MAKDFVLGHTRVLNLTLENDRIVHFSFNFDNSDPNVLTLFILTHEILLIVNLITQVQNWVLECFGSEKFMLGCVTSKIGRFFTFSVSSSQAGVGLA